MHFQHVLSLRELQQITDMLCVREIAGKFVSILLRMFICSCFFIKNARGDAAVEKKIDIAMQ